MDNPDRMISLAGSRCLKHPFLSIEPRDEVTHGDVMGLVFSVLHRGYFAGVNRPANGIGVHGDQFGGSLDFHGDFVRVAHFICGGAARIAAPGCIVSLRLLRNRGRWCLAG
jgi:hypothetical protein